jgi:tetratricopeptide (TPR) repeat protein
VREDLDRRLRRLQASGEPAELIDLGCDLAEAGRHRDAEVCFRRAAALGDSVGSFNLGNALAAQGRNEEAVEAYEGALAAGESDAWRNLGLVLEELGDLAGAMHAYRGAGEAGDPAGWLGLAFLLREQGEREDALVAAQQGAELGDPVAAAVVASWCWSMTFDPALEPDLRAGAAHYPSARADLGRLLRDTGRVDEARWVLEIGAKLGETESWLPLGNLYCDELGDEEAAEEAYRAGIRAGDVYCHHNLGLLLVERGDVDGAVEQFRLGVAAGDDLALRALEQFEEPPAL